jgi:hypothetical protein
MGKLEEIKNIKIEDKSTSTDQIEIKYHGAIIPVKNDKLKADFQKFQAISAKIDSEKELARKVNIYSDAFNLLDEITKLVKKEKTDDPSKCQHY